jgi:predicted nuclease of predicted toxin-antitoxin system
MSRYLIDANLPRHASVWVGGNCEFVADINAALPDADIWKYAAAHRLTIVSKDADFTNLALLDAAGPSVIQLRVGNMKFREFDAFLTRTWNDICGLSSRYRLIQVFLDRIEAVS